MFAPRCPWCGAIIPINFKRRELHFMTDFCSKCGHEIKLKKDSRQFWLNALCNASLVALPAIKYENTVSSHIGIRTIRSFDHSKESSPNPYTCQEDDTPATEGDTRMRTSEVGLVNDVTLIGNLKIKKFHPEEQN